MQLIKSTVHEKKAQAVSKNQYACSKTCRHVKHAGLEGVKKHRLVEIK